MLDLHVPAEVSLQIELTGAVRTLEGLVASMEMHMAQQVVHSVERLATYLKEKQNKNKNTDADEQRYTVDTVSTFHPVMSPQRLTLHLKGFTGRWTIMCVLRVCFWMKLLKQT